MPSSAGAAQLETPNTVLATEKSIDKEPELKKQKQEEPERPKRSFKAIANLVLAARRFQGKTRVRVP